MSSISHKILETIYLYNRQRADDTTIKSPHSAKKETSNLTYKKDIYKNTSQNIEMKDVTSFSIYNNTDNISKE